MKTIFVTGESGTIPMQIQQLSCESCSDSFYVINSQLTDNFLTIYKRHQSFKVRKLELDFLQRDFLLDFEYLWKNVNLIIHSGAFVGTDYCTADPTMAIRTNVEGTQNIVDICNKFNIPLVYLSTTAILDPLSYSSSIPMTENTKINPQTIYGITKYAGELIVKNTCKTKRIILRPVFGFGNYPDDLHSALTKAIYVLYRNLMKCETDLTILLDKEIKKSYTRVENIASCILNFANRLLDSDSEFPECSIYNIGEDYSKAKNWYQLFEIIQQEFVTRNLCTEDEFHKALEKIKFVPEKDYLHYHNMDDIRLRSLGLDFSSLSNYVSIEKGISLTIDSVINNIEMEPYWL